MVDREDSGRWTEGAPLRVLRFVLGNPGGWVRPGEVPGVAAAAASKALSALANEGRVERVRKGLYYVPKQTVVGMSRPTTGMVAEQVLRGWGRPTGVTAANLLGLSTQVSARPEVALVGSATPKGAEAAIVHLRQSGSRDRLPATDAGILEVLRDRARYSELSPEATVDQLLSILKAPEWTLARVRRLRTAALNEPPRVRAMLGALLQQRGFPASVWQPLARSLNPLSRFEFGAFRVLPNAARWQAK